jgi:hypothetical protein
MTQDWSQRVGFGIINPYTWSCKMKKKLLIGIIGTLAALSFGTSWAQYPPAPQPGYAQARPAPYKIQHRIDAQQREISNGIRAGVLNKNEARVLKDNISQIKREYKYAKRNGYVSMEERARLDGMLDRNARMIRRLENNAITRF